ncbi:MAG: HAD family phosphatase [Dehalococcoidales bacterium]|nr:HAD family phosphatase [Dehalococcoidales bacterium]
MAENKDFAVIWDMDGVIVNTGKEHFKSWQYAFQKRGVNFTEADFQTRFGQRNDFIVRSVMGDAVPPAEIDEIASDKEENFAEIVRDHVKPCPGAVELLKALGNAGVKSAIASSAPVQNIRLLLGTLGIFDSFQQFVSGREVTESKPSPQIYLLAAEKLGAKPEKCIVIEDAVAGVQGAKRAGMYCVAVTTTNPRENLQTADLVVDSLAELTVKSLENLVKSGHKN